MGAILSGCPADGEDSPVSCRSALPAMRCAGSFQAWLLRGRDWPAQPCGVGAESLRGNNDDGRVMTRQCSGGPEEGCPSGSGCACHAVERFRPRKLMKQLRPKSPMMIDGTLAGFPTATEPHGCGESARARTLKGKLR